MKTHLVAAVLALVAASAPSIAAQKTPDLTPYLIPEQAVEVALARTAAPANVSGAATVLVLTRTGYVEAAKGTNGFTCLVARSFHAPFGDPNFWNAKFRAPHCLNPAASRTVLPELTKRAEWIMQGVSVPDIEARTKTAFASHALPMPAPGAMAYMMSPKQYLSDTEPHWMPHLMFYFDKSTPTSAFGAAGFKAPVIDGSADDKDSPIHVILIPVRQWSDGTMAMGH